VRVAGILLVAVGYGWLLGEAYGPPAVTRATLSFPDLPPAFDGYRILLVSDLHAGPLAGQRTLGRWARAAQAIPCDLLVLAGDCVAKVPEETEVLTQAFAVMGNHDLAPGPFGVGDRLRMHGWKVLDDESLLLGRAGEHLLVLGARHPAEGSEGVPIPWKGKPWPAGFRIAVCHSPVLWPRMVEEGARLTLAGHTHGGQVNLSPVFNAAADFTPFVHGAYRQGGAWLFVTRGLGVTLLPFRFRCRPELALITLRRA
jgi:hypothetical protein